jgi:prepilin-type processing-associated H-X9-DG protein
MLGWRKLLVLAALTIVFFLLSGWTADGHPHSGTVSNVLWMDFLLGVLLLIVLAVANAARAVASLWR